MPADYLYEVLPYDGSSRSEVGSGGGQIAKQICEIAWGRSVQKWRKDAAI